MESLDTIQIKLVCGECYYWHASGNQQVNNDDRIMGLCFLNPPIPYLVQQHNPLTNQAMPGSINLRPPVADSEPACGSFCPKEADPLKFPEEIEPH